MDNSFTKTLVSRDELAELFGCNYKTVAALEDKGVLQRITLPWSSKCYYKKSAAERLIKVATDDKDCSATTLDGLRYAVVIEAFTALTKGDADVDALRSALTNEMVSNSSFTADSVADFLYRQRDKLAKQKQSATQSKPVEPPVVAAKVESTPVVDDDDDDETFESFSEIDAMVGVGDSSEPEFEPIAELNFGREPKAKK